MSVSAMCVSLRALCAIGCAVSLSGCVLPPLRHEILVVDPALCALSDTDEGEAAGTEGGLSYMFCIPNNVLVRSQVAGIDPSMRFDEGPRARSECGAQAVLCIGSTRQPGFKSIVDRLSKLPYINKISLCPSD